jgi:vacuolar-type H+-ATPase subunit F/Vma7
MEIVMVGHKHLASGFRLIGIETDEVVDDDAAAKKVESVVLEGKYKIIIINEKVALKTKALRDDLLTAKKPYPVFLIVPDFQGPLNERTKELHQLVDKAIGIKLNLEG